MVSSVAYEKYEYVLDAIALAVHASSYPKRLVLLAGLATVF